MSFTASLADIVRENSNGLLGDGGGLWPRVPLLQVASIQNGYPFPSAQFDRENGVPLIRIRDIDSDTTEVCFNGSYDESFVVNAGDLLIGMDGDFHAHTWRGPRGLLNQRVCRITPSTHAVDIRYLSHVLPGYLAAINAKTSSITVKHLSSRTISEIPLPLPPIDEQRRIASMLDEYLSDLTAANATMGRARVNALALARAVREQLVSGYRCVPLGGLLSEPLANGRSVPTATSGFPVLRLNALRNGGVDLRQHKLGAWSAAEAARYVCREGDFLVVRGNGSRHLVGRGGLVGRVEPPVAFPDTLIRVRTKGERMSAAYLRVVWDAASVRRQIEMRARTTAGIYKISQPDIEAVLVPLPPRAAQDAIVEAAETAFVSTTRLLSAMDVQKARALRLERAILHAALERKLIPQPTHP